MLTHIFTDSHLFIQEHMFNFVELVRMPDGVHAIIEKPPTELSRAEASHRFDSCGGTDNM